MWRYFGNDGGCCIEFDTKELFDCYNSYVDGIPQSQLNFGIMMYDQREQYENEMNSRLDEISNLLDRLKDKPELVNDFVSNFVYFISMLKHQAFFEEREIRAIIFSNPKQHEHEKMYSRSQKMHSFDKLKIPINLTRA